MWIWEQKPKILMFKRDWTTCSEIANFLGSIYNIIGDMYNHLRKIIFTLITIDMNILFNITYWSPMCFWKSENALSGVNCWWWTIRIVFGTAFEASCQWQLPTQMQQWQSWIQIHVWESEQRRDSWFTKGVSRSHTWSLCIIPLNFKLLLISS